MTRIYRVQTEPGIEIVRANLDRLWDLSLEPKPVTWKTMKVSLIREETDGEALRTVDFPSVQTAFIAMKESAYRVLRANQLAADGQFLDLESRDGDLWIFHTTRIVTDCVDESKSTIDRFSDGAWRTFGRVAFLENRLPEEAALFKIPQTPAIFARQKFVDLVSSHNLTGLEFREVFAS